MTYNHLRELKAMGYIADGENGYVITDAGRIASIGVGKSGVIIILYSQVNYTF